MCCFSEAAGAIKTTQPVTEESPMRRIANKRLSLVERRGQKMDFDEEHHKEESSVVELGRELFPMKRDKKHHDRD